jgi:HPt (histidine-containing phosphotransfer) domain-containing protein
MTAAKTTAMRPRYEIRSERRKPTLDAQHLEKLAEESSWEVAESFATEYTALLPRRVDRIVRTVTVRDRDTAMNASLSLKTTSWLAGALRMNQLCRELELALALTDVAAVASIVQDIEQHLPRLQEALAGRRRHPLAASSLAALPR